MRLAAIIAVVAFPCIAQFNDARLMWRLLYPGTMSGSNAMDSTGRSGPAIATGITFAASSMSAGASATAILQTQMTGTLATNESCTATLWFKTQYVSNMALIGVNMGAPGTQIAMEVGSVGTAYISCRDADSANADVCSITNELRDNKWHHFAGIYDGPAKQIRMYYDGNSSSNATVTTNSGSTAKTWTNGIGVGAIRALTGTLRPFNGSIADVRLYRAALSQDEIKAIASEFVP